MGSLKQIFFSAALRTILSTVLLILFAVPAHSQFFQFETKRKRLLIPVKQVKNLLIIPIYINQKGPFNFILDSGVGIAVITDSKLIDSVHIENVRSVAITGFGAGKDLSAYIAPQVEFSLIPTVKANIPTAILKSDALDLSGFTGMPIHGLIGYEFFSSFLVRINYSSGSVIVYPKDTHYIMKKGYRIPITVEENKPYLTTELSLKPGTKTKVKLIIDTGAGHPLSMETNKGIPFEVPQKKIHANLGVGLSGKIDGYIARVSALRIGKFVLKDVLTSFPDYDHVGAKIRSFNRNGNIGNGVLKKFDIVFDYNRESLYIRPNGNYKEPFEHDMSGLEFISAGENYKQIIITRVEPGSAGAEAGLQEGDEILSINLKSVADMSIDEIDSLFKSQNERSFLILIRRKGINNQIRVILELKKRI